MIIHIAKRTVYYPVSKKQASDLLAEVAEFDVFAPLSW